MLERPALIARMLLDPPGLFQRLYQLPWYGGMLEDWIAELSLSPGQSVLEVGCGPGLLCRHMSRQGLTVTGLDRSFRMIGRARRNNDQTVLLERGSLPWQPPFVRPFQAVVAASLLNLASHPFQTVLNMGQLTESGGVVSALFPLPGFARHVEAAGDEMALTGFSRAALLQWGRFARTLAMADVTDLFRRAGLQDRRERLYLGGLIGAVSGRAP